MARKNARHTDATDVYLFDTRTKAVMAQPAHQEGIKEKVQSIREVVPGKSNNEIALVLQHYDYNVEQAIQAYLEDGAKEALKDWHFSGAKVINKKKKNKKKKELAKEAEVQAAKKAELEIKNDILTDVPPLVPSNTTTSTNESTKLHEVPVVNGHEPPHEDSTEKKLVSHAPVKHVTHALPSASHAAPKHARPKTLDTGSREHRERTFSEASCSSVASSTVSDIRKPYAGLEKSIRDLQRQTTSLQRLKLILNEEVDKSFKAITKTFNELRNALNDREAELIYEMDKAKFNSSETLTHRQDKAAELKMLTSRAQVMNDTELQELRADIKHFVSDRKVDEDMTKTTTISFDLEPMLLQVKKFGQISGVKSHYTQRRPSVDSVSSSVVSHDDLTPVTPSTPYIPQNMFFGAGTNRAQALQSRSTVTHQPSTTSTASKEVQELARAVQNIKIQDPARRDDKSSAKTSEKPQAQKSSDASPDELAKKSRNARRRRQQRDRVRRDVNERNSAPPTANGPEAGPSSNPAERTANKSGAPSSANRRVATSRPAGRTSSESGSPSKSSPKNINNNNQNSAANRNSNKDSRNSNVNENKTSPNTSQQSGQQNRSSRGSQQQKSHDQKTVVHNGPAMQRPVSEKQNNPSGNKASQSPPGNIKKEVAKPAAEKPAEHKPEQSNTQKTHEQTKSTHTSAESSKSILSEKKPVVNGSGDAANVAVVSVSKSLQNDVMTNGGHGDDGNDHTAKKTSVSVAENHGTESLPQRAPRGRRERQNKKVEVMVNGDLHVEVNGHDR